MAARKLPRRLFPESEFNMMDFDYFGTIVSGKCQEIDIFRPLEPSGESPDLEIRIILALQAGGESMVFSSLSLTTHAGAPVSLSSTRGGRLDPQMAEVSIWEAIEDHDRAFDYYYGRRPMGAGVKPGTFIPAADTNPPSPDLA